MSLSYDVTKIENYEEVCWNIEVVDGEEYCYLKPLSQSLVFLTMSVGIGNLTEKNAGEFYARMKIIGLITKFDYIITPADIKNHIGLSTNVLYESRTAWIKCWVTLELNDFVAEYNKGIV